MLQIIYLDNILIFSNIEEEYIYYIKKVLQRLQNLKLYIKLLKYKQHTDYIEYLSYIVLPKGVSINLEQVKTIQDQLLLASIYNIYVFVGFINYYRQFIKGFSRIVLLLTTLTKKEPRQAQGSPAIRREESTALKLLEEAKQAF